MPTNEARYIVAACGECGWSLAEPFDADDDQPTAIDHAVFLMSLHYDLDHNHGGGL